MHSIAAGHTARRALAFDRAGVTLVARRSISRRGREGGRPPSLARRVASAGRGAESAASYPSSRRLGNRKREDDRTFSGAGQSSFCAPGMSTKDFLRSTPSSHRWGCHDRAASPMRSASSFRAVPGGADPSFVGFSLSAIDGRRLWHVALTPCWTTGLGLSWIDPVAAAVFHSRYLRLSRRLGDPVRVALGLCMYLSGAFGGLKRARDGLWNARGR